MCTSVLVLQERTSARQVRSEVNGAHRQCCASPPPRASRQTCCVKMGRSGVNEAKCRIEWFCNEQLIARVVPSAPPFIASERARCISRVSPVRHICEKPLIGSAALRCTQTQTQRRRDATRRDATHARRNEKTRDARTHICYEMLIPAAVDFSSYKRQCTFLFSYCSALLVCTVQYSRGADISEYLN